jgi:DNA-binding NarL/FixJ family response regulator
VLADDHKAVREEIESMLAPDFEVVSAACDGAELLAAVRRHRPELVVCDIQMPLVNGIEAGRRILEEGLCRAVVVLTMYRETHLVEAALEAGIRGYLLKEDAAEELIAALQSVAKGETYLSRGVRGREAG